MTFEVVDSSGVTEADEVNEAPEVLSLKNHS